MMFVPCTQCLKLILCPCCPCVRVSPVIVVPLVSYFTPPPPLLQGLQGDMVLVAGINTGTAKVQVRLRERAWQGVEPDIVKLLVIENMMLQPFMDVYILPLSFVEYRVERRKHGRSEVIAMPSEQYSLELTNTTVGRLHPQRSRVTGLVVGYTEAVLQDISILILCVCVCVCICLEYL